MIIRKRGIRKLIFEMLYLAERLLEKKTNGKAGETSGFEHGFSLGQVSAYRSLVEILNWDYYYDNFKYSRKDIERKQNG